MGGSVKGGGGAPQQQGASGYGGFGGKGGGGMPQAQGMPAPGTPPQGTPPAPNPEMLQQMQQMMQQRQQQMGGGMPPPPGGMEGMRPPGMGYDQQQRMQQMMAMGRGMEGGINSLQKPPPPPGGGAPMFLGDQGTATPNSMPPPPAAATGASPGGPLSGRNFNPGFGGQRGFGMGRFGGYRGQGRFGGGMPGAAPGAMAPGVMPTPAGSDGIAGLQPQQGYATGGRVSWTPGAVTSSGGGSMFANVAPLAAIQQPAAYVAPAATQAIWTPPAAAAATSANRGGPYGGLSQSAWMQQHGYGTLNQGTGMYQKYGGGSGSHGGGRG